MKANLKNIIPVLPASDMIRDVAWYKKYLGFDILFGDESYAGLKREDIEIHLQWHANTAADPLLGGSVARIFVNDIDPIFLELVERGAVSEEKLIRNTAWNTHEFGLYDLNQNAIFFVQVIN